MQLTLQKKRQRADLLTLAAVAALFLVLAGLLGKPMQEKV